MLARREKPLKDHLLRTARIAEQLAGKLKIDLDREAYLAGLFHDVGKADVGAQRKIAQGYEAAGYEVISAVVAFEVLRELEVDRRFTVVWAIMRHHRPMRSAQETLDMAEKWFEGKIADREELEATLKEGTGAPTNVTWPTNCRMLEERIREMQTVFEKYYTQSNVQRARLLAGVVNIADTHSE